jgi:hypothetical protein
MPFVPDVIQRASSGRAKCRGCTQAIAKGELRFGESLANAYAEGEALYWFHLYCASAMRPEKFLPVLEQSSESIDERDDLRKTAELGVSHHRLPRLLRAERAPSGRAHCRSCRELIEKGEWRLSLQMFEETRFSPIGSIHAGCSEAYFGTAEILDRLKRLTAAMSEDDLQSLVAALAVQRAAPPETDQAGDASATEAETPGLAKTRGGEAETSARAGGKSG